MGASDCLQGIRNVPTKLRIQISRKRNDDEDAKVSKHVCAHIVCVQHAFSVFEGMEDVESHSPVGLMCMLTLQEDMYSYVTVADDQQYKGKGTEVVDA